MMVFFICQENKPWFFFLCMKLIVFYQLPEANFFIEKPRQTLSALKVSKTAVRTDKSERDSRYKGEKRGEAEREK